MTRLAIGVLSVLAFSAFGLELGCATAPSQAEVDTALATVKSVPASKLDRDLPETRFEDWLETQAGPEGRAHWDYQYGNETSDPVHFVEAVVTFNKEQSFFISIEVGEHRQHPSFDSGWVIVGRQRSIELKRLGDLPQVLKKLRLEWSDSEAIR